MLYQVTPNRGIQLVQAGDGPTLIVNRDPTNALLIGNDAGIATVLPLNLSIVDPLGSRTVGGLVDVWGVAQNASITVDVQTGAVAWSPSPAQIAAQIQASGVFINTNSTEIANVPNTTVPSNSSVVAGTFNLNQIGYEIRVVSSWNAAPTDDFLLAVRLDWIDSTTGQIVFTDRWYMGGSTGPALITTGSGPTKGNQVKITFVNSDLGGVAATVSCVMLVNSRTYVKDDWRWSQPRQTGVTFANYNPPTGLDGTNLLATFSGNQSANTRQWYPLGLYAGRISLSWMEAVQNWSGGQPIVTWAIAHQGTFVNQLKTPLREPDGMIEFVGARFPASIEINNLSLTSSTQSEFVAIGLD